MCRPGRWPLICSTVQTGWGGEGRGEGGGGGGRPDKGQSLVLRFGVGDGSNHPNM